MRRLAYILIVFTAFSCSDKEFTEISSGIEKKLIVFGEGKTRMAEANYVDVSYSVSAKYGNPNFQKSNRVFLADAHPRVFGNKELADDIQGLVNGDSVHYRLEYKFIKDQILDEFVNADLFLSDTVMIDLFFNCNSSMTKSEYLTFKENKVREGLKLEMELITEFMDSENYRDKFTRKGDLFYMKTKETSGTSIKTHSDISVAYKCSFLNGKVFQRIEEDAPQYLNVSSPDQLITGLTSVVKEMNEGEECRVIIPSYLAFGEDGSTDGTVPPKTPIIVDIKIIEIF